ncbi:hypothetical protein OIU79_009576 [Salix purpurea]|uniref:Uncharacterized protein n=1 Tax=Salix purpurea TaxID=77065 RepID=A0A9Q0T8S3_SALPP|nr:hypothetical protein OIU79_009576 [Salix purpurea]
MSAKARILSTVAPCPPFSFGHAVSFNKLMCAESVAVCNPSCTRVCPCYWEKKHSIS